MGKLNLYQNSYFDGLRAIQDDSADQAVRVLLENPLLIGEINTWREIPAVLPAHFPEGLASYFLFYRQIKASAPAVVLAKGQEIFDKKGGMYLAMLGFYSLPYCYAFADGAQVLVRSRRILEEIGKRLGETGIFVLDIFEPGAFMTRDKAYLTCAKVRLIHAFSRHFIHAHAPDWNEGFGAPINQEDMIGTNLAFSLIVLRGWRKLGYPVSAAETDTILNYWNWVGELMGIDTASWPANAKEAYELDKLLRKRHIRYSEAGALLTGALLDYLGSTLQEPVLKDRIAPIVSFFLGKEAAAAVRLGEQLPLKGEVLGMVLKLSGWLGSGKQQGHRGVSRQFEAIQKDQFGEKPEISLPELKRS